MTKRQVILGLLSTAPLVIVLVVAPLAFPLTRTLAPTLFGMIQVDETFFVDASMTKEQVARLRTSREQAQALLVQTWSSRRTNPPVIACSTLECFRFFGGKGGRGLHFADRILLAPRGLNATIVAHEWCHAEFRARAGFFTRVPAWFDEGLAVVVSHDSRYSESVYQDKYGVHAPPSPLHDLETLDRFFIVDDAYLVSAHEVRSWLGRVGVGGLDTLVQSIASGTDFYLAYPDHE